MWLAESGIASSRAATDWRRVAIRNSEREALRGLAAWYEAAAELHSSHAPERRQRKRAGEQADDG